MKHYLLFSLLFLIACTNSPGESNEGKTENQEEKDETQEPSNLDAAVKGQWLLDKIEGESFVIEEQNGLRKTPQIEIIEKDSRFQGNDGCNNIAGAVNNSEKGSIEFSQIAKTKMACMNMEIPDRFTKNLENTKKYKVEAGNLILLDENNKVLLSFEKIQ